MFTLRSVTISLRSFGVLGDVGVTHADTNGWRRKKAYSHSLIANRYKLEVCASCSDMFSQ